MVAFIQKVLTRLSSYHQNIFLNLKFLYNSLQKFIEIVASKAKGGFFSESVIRFSNLQDENTPKNYPELEI